MRELKTKMMIRRQLIPWYLHGTCLLCLLSMFLIFACATLSAQQFKVQRGVATVTGTGVTLNAPADFEAVSSLSSAFVRITNSQHTGAGNNSGGGNQNADDVTCNIRFASTSQISISRFSNADNSRVCWEIVEYVGVPGGSNEFVVRGHGLSVFDAGGTVKSETFAGAVTQNRLVAFITGVSDPLASVDSYNAHLVSSEITALDTVQFERGRANNNATVVSYAVVEFTGADWTVERLEHNYATAGVVETETLSTAVDPANAFVHAQKRNTHGGGPNATNRLADYGHQVWVSASDQVSFRLHASANRANRHSSVAWVLSNPNMRVQHSNGTIPAGGAEPQTLNLAIDAVGDLSNASVFWNNDCDGTGTAFPRPIIAVRMTAVDNVEAWRSDTGQPNDFRMSVVEWFVRDPQTYYVSQSTGSDVTGDGSVGNPFASISHAVSQAYDGDIIEVVDAVHTESGVDIDKGLIVQGRGASASIVQAHAVQGSAADRVFSVSAAGSVSFRDMYIRHGLAPGVENGGGILITNGTVSIEDCVIHGNRAQNGGGIMIQSGASVVIRRTSFSYNDADLGGGGIRNEGSLDIHDSTIAMNTGYNAPGGGITHTDSGAGVLNIYNSTISGNRTRNEGAGIMIDGAGSVVFVYNSTITANSARSASGGGGIYRGNGALTMVSTIIGDNLADANPDIFCAAGTRADHCLISDMQGVTLDSDTNNIKNQSPRLDTLMDNGGSTQTHAPLAGSPIIDNGSNPLALLYDQRGIGFNREYNGVADIGAYENSFVVEGTLYLDEAKSVPAGAGENVRLSINGAAPLSSSTNAAGQFAFTPDVSPDDVLLFYKELTGGWNAYHTIQTVATGTNITQGNDGANLPDTQLLNYADGNPAGPFVNIAWSANGAQITNGDQDPAAGTDAHNIFGDKMNLGAPFFYLFNGTVTISFSNLDTDKKYTAAVFVNANGYGGYRNRFQIGGISGSTQTSSSGVNVTDEFTVDYSWDNTNNGYVARWTDIDPDGTDFTITITSATDNFLIGPTAIMLQEQVESTDSASYVTVTDGVTELRGVEEIEMVTGKIILSHQTGTEITNAQLDLIDQVPSDDADGITISGANANFATGRELWIASGKTYAPGGDVSCHGLLIDGSYINSGSESISCGGSWRNNGSFTAADSTVQLSSATAAQVAGDTVFNNLRITSPGKSLTFAAGSTQTVNGLFRVEGDSAASRISLASSGGAGTTWNLVLNDRHDCRYVAVQGSNASGSAHFPIAPAGFLDNDDNSNWYSAAFPREMLFYDNFETSIPAASPPDKESSYWNITDDSWRTEPAAVVNTQNRTSGGSLSAYSRGGNNGEGIGMWNNPRWGPATDVTAEAWFYDDMQNPKKQFIFVVSEDGMSGTGVKIDTDVSTTKYSYVNLVSSTPTAYITQIDRTVGWHKITWNHAVGDVTLFLDDVELFTTTIPDFTQFDAGTYTWDNVNGCTPMWFDDFMVFRSQHQTRYRWYDNDNAQNPTPLAAENTTINRDNDLVTRLRVQLQNDETQAWSDAHIGLQFRQGVQGVWQNLGADRAWDYANGLGNDGDTLAFGLLTNTDVPQHFVESQPTTPNLSVAPLEYAEWDFAIQATTTAAVGADYYFRMVETDDAGNFAKVLSAYAETPRLTLVSPNLVMWTGNVSTAWDNTGNWLPNVIPNLGSDVLIPASAARDCRVNINGAECNNIFIENGRTLFLDTVTTSLSVGQNMTLQGVAVHSEATAQMNIGTGELLIDGGTYNLSAGAGINAANATIKTISGGALNAAGTGTVTAATLQLAAAGLVQTTNATTYNIVNFVIDLNGQWRSTSTTNNVNVSGNFVNNGSMLGSTGGNFRFTGVGGIISGTSTTTYLYDAIFAAATEITMTNHIFVLNDLTVLPGNSLDAGSSSLKVGRHWLNQGSFLPGTGTVELNGTALQQVTTGAGGTWNSLVVSNSSGAGVSFLDGFAAANFANNTPASTMTFTAGETYEVSAASGLSLTGGAGNEIILISDTPGTMWEINPSGGGWNVDYVNVSDSVNIFETTILPGNSTDGGNTVNWFSRDRDGDEIADYWEYIYYGDITTVDAGSDTDGDGLNTFLEFLLGSNPTVPHDKIIHVDPLTRYEGNDGSLANPYKYLEDAVAAAEDGYLIKLAEGTYSLDNTTISKRIVIAGTDPRKTIIKGPAPDASSGEKGRMIDVTARRFALANVTIRKFEDERPIISYRPVDGAFLSFQNLVFRENKTGAFPLIAPIEGQSAGRLFILNCVFHDNIGSAMAELQSAPAMAYHNTIVNNTGAGLVASGSSDTNIYNSIIRGNSGAEISDSSSGSLTVSNCNIEGGFGGAINSYDTAPDFIDAANKIFRILGAPDLDTGISSFVTWDRDDIARPNGAAPDVGAYEMDPDDPDNDGLTNAEEIALGTDSQHPDTDRDGLYDGEEVNVYGTDPRLAYSSGGPVNDGDSIPVGINPAVSDGVTNTFVFDESFESDTAYPVGPWSNTLWGADSVYGGNVTVDNIGSDAYDGNKVVTLNGDSPPSYVIGLVPRNGVENYWMWLSWKIPRAKLPTVIEEANNIAGCYFTVDENGYLNVYDGSTETWRTDTVVLPEDEWITTTFHRDHNAKTVDVWINGRAAFSNIPVSGIDPPDHIRVSMSSVQEKTARMDKIVGSTESPF